MNIAICRLTGLASGPQLPPLDVKSAIIVKIMMMSRLLSTVCPDEHTCCISMLC